MQTFGFFALVVSPVVIVLVGRALVRCLERKLQRELCEVDWEAENIEAGRFTDKLR